MDILATHHLDDSRENLHGWFSRTLPPRLRVASGDTVIYKTRDSGWNDRQPGRMEPRKDRPEGAGHALSGPVFIAGAEPGDTLEIRIGAMVTANWAFNGARPGRAAISGLLGGEPDDIAEPFFRFLSLDPAAGVAAFAPGIAVPLAPFMGIYATTPDTDRAPTSFPGTFGGNMDCKELVSGTTLYLPVFVPGALFSVGDGHGA